MMENDIAYAFDPLSPPDICCRIESGPLRAAAVLPIKKQKQKQKQNKTKTESQAENPLRAAAVEQDRRLTTPTMTSTAAPKP